MAYGIITWPLKHEETGIMFICYLSVLGSMLVSTFLLLSGVCSV